MTSNITPRQNPSDAILTDADSTVLDAPWSRRTALAAAAGLLAAMATGTRPTLGRLQQGTPDGSTGVTTQVLGSMEVPTAPGETLSLRRIVFEPGASLDPHTHPGVTIYWIESGTLGFTLLAGEASITRGDDTTTAATPAAAEPVPVGAEVSATAGDVLLFDETAAQSEQALGDEPVVIMLTHLGPTDRPFREPVEGTPAT